jgi:hypothetical protein
MSGTTNGTTTASFAGTDRIVFDARRGDGPIQTYVQSVEGGPPTRVEHEPGQVVSPVASDGNRFISRRSDGSLWMAALGPRAATRLPFTLLPNQFIRQWSTDGQHVFVLTLGDDRWVFTRVDTKTGRTLPHREVMRDRMEDGMFGWFVRISRDGGTIVGTGHRRVSDLFLIANVR